MENITIQLLQDSATEYAEILSGLSISGLFWVTDGKAVWTFVEHEFKNYLSQKFIVHTGNSARWIDLPELWVDIKVTSIQQPQSSCPFKSARQKIFGLWYSLLVFVYEKTDDHINKTSRLRILHCIYVEEWKTADFQTTTWLINILNNNWNRDDLVSFMFERNLPIDDIEAENIADEILLAWKLEKWYLTISNALQWRLQYARIIQVAWTDCWIKKLI